MYDEPFSTAEVGKLPFSDVFTPGELKADVATLTTRVKAFGDDVSGKPSSDPKVLAFRANFAAWSNEYFKWASSLGLLSWALNSTRDKARSYSDSLNQWVTNWKALGGEIAVPAAVAPPTKDIAASGRSPLGGTDMAAVVRNIALVGGVIVGGYVAVQLFSKR